MSVLSHKLHSSLAPKQSSRSVREIFRPRDRHAILRTYSPYVFVDVCLFVATHLFIVLCAAYNERAKRHQRHVRRDICGFYGRFALSDALPGNNSVADSYFLRFIGRWFDVGTFALPSQVPVYQYRYKSRLKQLSDDSSSVHVLVFCSHY